MATQKKIRIHPGEILREEFLLPRRQRASLGNFA